MAERRAQLVALRRGCQRVLRDDLALADPVVQGSFEGERNGSDAALLEE